MMAVLLGIGLVAALLYLAGGHGGWHAGQFGEGWRGSGMHHYGNGWYIAPWVVVGLIGALLVATIGLFPLLVMAGGGYLVYRMASGRGPRVPAMAFRPTGPGAAPAPVEDGIFCPSCERPVSRHWATCPHCGYRKYVAPDLIQRRCATCGTELQKEWSACPYCSTRIDAPAVVPAPGPAQPKSAPAPVETSLTF